MFAAKRLCENAGLDFGHVFSRQYSLSKYGLPLIEGWGSPKQLSGWTLAHCPKLECQSISDKAGEPIGWFLGTAVDQNGALVEGKMTLPTQVNMNNFWDVIENEITFLTGRYIAFLITKKGNRAYFDPVMDLPLVFCAKEKMVGASPLMALNRKLRFNHRINRKLIMKEGGNYGMQQTCDPDVCRGLSNHYLDLDSFTLHRHWPSADEPFESDNVDDLRETADQIVSRLAQVTEALLVNHPCALPLTGGSDSRILAFSAKEKIHFAKCFSHRTNWITGLDCFVASLLAEKLGQDLRIIDVLSDQNKGTLNRKDIRRLRKEFYYRTGYQKAPINSELVAFDRIPETRFVLRGNILDMTRANRWPQDCNESIEHSVNSLGIGGRQQEENFTYWAPEYKNWLSTLPLPAQARAQDFAFVEQLLPNTLGGRLIGLSKAIYLNPFNDRKLIKACMRVNPKTRKSGQLNKLLWEACGAPNVPFASEVRRSSELKTAASKLFE